MFRLKRQQCSVCITDGQCFLVGQNIRYLTPKFVHFLLSKKIFSGWKYPKKNYLISKNEALQVAQIEELKAEQDEQLRAVLEAQAQLRSEVEYLTPTIIHLH